MSGGLKVGDLFVLLSAKTSAFGKGMEDAAKLTERVAKKIKRSAEEIGRVGALIGAAVGAAMALAAQHNAAVASAVQQTKNVFATFANEIATMMLPVIRSMNEKLRELLGWWQSLSPEAKAHVAHWVEIATTVGIAALAIGKIAGLVHALAPAFGAVGAAIGAIGLWIVPIIVGIGGIVIAIGYLHKNWVAVWNAIQSVAHTVLKALEPVWNAFASFVGTVWSGIVDEAALAAKAILAIWLSTMTAMGKMDDRTSGFLMENGSAAINGIAMGAKSSAGLKAMMMPGLQAINEFVTEGFGEAKKAMVEFADWVKKEIGFTGKQGRVMDVQEQVYTMHEGFGSLKKLGEEGEQGKMTQLLADQYEDEIWLHKKFNEQVGLLQNAVAAGIQSFASKLGDLGQMINAGIQGFQSGGVWGAIIAVFVELLSKFKRFQELIDIGNGQVQAAVSDLASSFSDLIDGLKPLMGAIGMIAHVVHEILAPIISFIGKILGSLAPVFALISVVLTPLAGSLQTLFDVIGQTLGPAFAILNVIATGLAMVFLGLNEAVLYVKAGLLEFLRWLDHTFNPTGNHSGTDQAAADAWAELHKNEQQMKDIADHGLAGVASKSADTAEALGKLGDTADQVSRQLTNIPTGFNTALAEWRASFATSSTGGGSGTIAYGDSEYQSYRQTGNATKSSGSSYHRGKNKNDTSDL